MATELELTRFHDPAYIAALRQAERDQAVSEDVRMRFRIGADGNPVYREVYRRPGISAGGVMLAVRLAAAGRHVHCPGGGTHHGRPDRASGFCFLNDPVLGLLTWLDMGLENIVYLDIDAHHGDGVQDAFHDDPRVFTISLHEGARWPFTGAGTDRAVVRALMQRTSRLVVLGGGGYNPWTVGRCWALIWGTLNDFPIPDRLPCAAEAGLRGLRFDRAAGRNPPDHWFTTLLDRPREGPVRDAIRKLTEETLPA
jgi:acetoin utilization deacetylase AcuC-like enzyme